MDITKDSKIFKKQKIMIAPPAGFCSISLVMKTLRREFLFVACFVGVVSALVSPVEAGRKPPPRPPVDPPLAGNP
jgi:hypothetical protein